MTLILRLEVTPNFLIDAPFDSAFDVIKYRWGPSDDSCLHAITSPVAWKMELKVI